MSQIVIDTNTIVDRCASCGFFWVDFGELASVVRLARQELAGRPVPPELDEWLGDPGKLAEYRQNTNAAHVRRSLGDYLFMLFSRLWL